MTEPTRTVRAAAGMAAITAVSRLVGFVRVLVIAAVLGTTYLGNAFQSANSVSNVLFELVAAGALSAVLVPAFVDLLDADDQRGAEEVAGGVLGVAMAGLGAVAAVGMLLSPWLAKLLTLGVPANVAQAERRLVAFLLLFFLPQVVMYAAGTVATGVLHAKRRFLAAAAAPMANTVVMVASLLLFQASAGSDPSLEITGGERLLLALAGTGGVVAFTGVLVVACLSTGFRLRPRFTGRDPRVVRVLRQAGWGVVLHTSAGVLLGGAILAGAAVEGGVVAYQVAWVFFLAPYAIFSQPIHTAILPELVIEARDETLARFARSVRWALERIALSVLPATALMVALAGPAMRVVSVGKASHGQGPELIAVAVAALALGLFPYGSFLLLARAWYALGDSRTPGMVALVVAAVGAGIMAVGAPLTHGAARIAVLGIAHSAAHVVGSVILSRKLAQRAGESVFSPVLALMAGINLLLGLGLWAAASAVLPEAASRGADLAVSAVGALITVALLAGIYRVVDLRGRLTDREPALPLVAA